MTDTKIYTEAQLRAAVRLDLAAIEAVESGFHALANGGVIMPPIMSMDLPDLNAELDVKTAYIPGLEGFAVKISPGFFDNPARGLPSTSGLMVLLSSQTGRASAVFLDNGYLTDLRTAAAGAIAARALSRADSTDVTIFGAGLQARMQLAALRLVRPITRVTLWARDMDKARAMAAELEPQLDVSLCADGAQAVAGADIIITTTPATQPVLRAAWLEACQHITAMGSDQSGKSELEPACLDRADLYVADRLSQTRVQGELRAAIAAGVVAADADFPELGEVLQGISPGRVSPEQITIADLTGTGVQDTAIATYALDALSRKDRE